MERIILLTGGNIGDLEHNMQSARTMLSQRVGREVAASTLHGSRAWGFESEDLFLNQVIVLDTELSSEQLLDTIQQIEHELGRVRDPQQPGYASRTMDIDILFYGDHIIATDRLTIPHPLISERDFVLNPLAEILPQLVHPQLGITIKHMKDQLNMCSMK